MRSISETPPSHLRSIESHQSMNDGNATRLAPPHKRLKWLYSTRSGCRTRKQPYAIGGGIRTQLLPKCDQKSSLCDLAARAEQPVTAPLPMASRIDTFYANNFQTTPHDGRLISSYSRILGLISAIRFVKRADKPCQARLTIEPGFLS
jgi:hypothetical protein